MKHNMKCQTIKNTYTFLGKGLHSGQVATMTLKPAPEGFGIKFVRTDIEGAEYIAALAENVSSTARSTTLSNAKGESVMTVEHLLSACFGLGIDNILIELSNIEVPILDGSAKPYIDAIVPDGLLEQDEERKILTIEEGFEYPQPEKGSRIVVTPCDDPTIECNVDFDSQVVGIQKAVWNLSNNNYATEVGICRTFVFFHELEYLASLGLIKGGDVDNAIVIVEHPVTDEQLERMAKIFGAQSLTIQKGYLNNLELRFPDEIARHKLLDMMGDFALCGGYVKAKIEGYKSGHGINTTVAKLIREKIK